MTQKTQKNLSAGLHSTQKIKEIQEIFFKLEERFSNFKNYSPQDDLEHRNIKNIRNLFNGAFNQSIDEYYYRFIT